jgi:putative ABC transport system permease protein
VSPTAKARLERAYRGLLFVYPPAFRRRHGEDLARVFEDELRAAQAAGRTARLRVVGGAVTDVLRSAPGLWLEHVQEAVREAPQAGEEPTRGGGGQGADLRYAWRGLRRQPGFLVSSVLTLALAIGANTALFTVADRALLRPLPYADADRLVTIWDTRPAEGRQHESPSPGNFLDWSARCLSFETMTAWMDGSGASTLRSESDVQVVETVKVTPSFFRVLGVAPLLGRTFAPEHERGGVFNVADRYTGGDRVLVMSHGLWTSRFGGDPTVIGRKVRLDGALWEVVGVMPADFEFPRGVEMWTTPNALAAGETYLAKTFSFFMTKIAPLLFTMTSKVGLPARSSANAALTASIVSRSAITSRGAASASRWAISRGRYAVLIGRSAAPARRSAR